MRGSGEQRLSESRKNGGTFFLRRKPSLRSARPRKGALYYQGSSENEKHSAISIGLKQERFVLSV
jgi:hypothetical protein